MGRRKIGNHSGMEIKTAALPCTLSVAQSFALWELEYHGSMEWDDHLQKYWAGSMSKHSVRVIEALIKKGYAKREVSQDRGSIVIILPTKKGLR